AVSTHLAPSSVKSSPAGEGIEVTISHVDRRVRVAVADHGCGIPAHELERVFERFHRVQETTTQTGTGLGLYIARQLAEEMDGGIPVERAPGRGSTFVLELPGAVRLVDVRVQAEIIKLEAG